MISNNSLVFDMDESDEDIIMREEENEFETSKAIENEHEIDESTFDIQTETSSELLNLLQSIVFSGQMSKYLCHFRVIKMKIYQENERITKKPPKKFSTHQAFERIKCFVAQCESCKKTITAYPHTSTHIERHFQACLNISKSSKNSSKVKGSKKPTSLPFRKRVLNFFVATGVPYAAIAHKSFAAMFDHEKVPSTKTLRADVDSENVQMLIDIKNILKKVDFVCLTADSWSSYNRNFIAVTCLLFDPQTHDKFSKKRLLLAIKQVSKSIDFELIANFLDETINKFNLKNKVRKVITDGGSNFIKAFKIYGRNEKSHDEYSELMDILNQENTQYDPSEAAVFIHELDSVGNLDLSLPERSPCVAHMLNLIGSKDAFFYVSNDDEFDEMYHQCFSKLKALWNISGRSPKFSSIFKTHVGLSLQKPSQTRWNSTFDSVFFLLNLISNDKLNAIYDAVTEFNENSHGKKFYFELTPEEITFLTEFIQVMKPLAICLDFFQSDNVTLGEFLPAIFQKLENPLNTMNNLVYCSSLKLGILSGIIKRFTDIKSDPITLPATILHPFFRKRRTMQILALSEEEFMTGHLYILRELARLSVSNELESNNTEISHDISTQYADSTNRLNNFFCFNDVNEENNLQDEILLLSYYEENCHSFDILDNKKYLKIRKLFFKLNVIVCSSASVERVFSSGKHILSSDRPNLSSENFEKLLMLKLNLPNINEHDF